MLSLLGTIRAQFIFHYYDINNDKKLDFGELGKLIYDTRRLSNQSTDNNTIEEIAKNMYNSMKIELKKPLTIEQFEEAVGKLHLRGTSVLFRSNTTFRKTGSNNQNRLLYPRLHNDFTTSYELMTGQKVISKAKCPTCRPKKYTLASHGVTLHETGSILQS